MTNDQRKKKNQNENFKIEKKFWVGRSTSNTFHLHRTRFIHLNKIHWKFQENKSRISSSVSTLFNRSIEILFKYSNFFFNSISCYSYANEPNYIVGIQHSVFRHLMIYCVVIRLMLRICGLEKYRKKESSNV